MRQVFWTFSPGSGPGSSLAGTERSFFSKASFVFLNPRERRDIETRSSKITACPNRLRASGSSVLYRWNAFHIGRHYFEESVFNQLSEQFSKMISQNFGFHVELLCEFFVGRFDR